jgi:hypothetical protein
MPKARPGWRLYPRGFVGGIPATKMERMEPHTTTLTHSQGRIVVSQPTDSELCVNDDVEALYSAYITRTGRVTTMEFRDAVLRAALRAFGSGSFFRWYSEQRSSPGMGDLQYRFLVDTLGYLQGKPRSMDMPMWESLIGAVQAIDPPQSYAAAAEQFFGAKHYEARARYNDSVVEVLQLWCSRPNGIEDLLQSLHLLFGNP